MSEWLRALVDSCDDEAGVLFARLGNESLLTKGAGTLSKGLSDLTLRSPPRGHDLGQRSTLPSLISELS
jgi:hypothetical protein